MPPEVRTLLSKFGDDWNAANAEPLLLQLLVRQRKVAHEAWINVIDIARADLFGEVRETVTLEEWES